MISNFIRVIHNRFFISYSHVYCMLHRIDFEYSNNIWIDLIYIKFIIDVFRYNYSVPACTKRKSYNSTGRTCICRNVNFDKSNKFCVNGVFCRRVYSKITPGILYTIRQNKRTFVLLFKFRIT